MPAAAARRSDTAPAAITAQDGTLLHHVDWGSGPPVLFLHSWALAHDMWAYQFAPLLDAGRRCIAYDRRGHGRSGVPGGGYDYDRLADDLAAVIEALDLNGLTLVGHSMAGGEIVRYLSLHGAARVEKLVLVAPTTPFLLKTADNPQGIDGAVFEAARAAWARDFPRWLDENAPGFVTPGTSPAMVRWLTGMMLRTPIEVARRCNRSVVETDFRAELARIQLPALVIHGDADVSAPLELTGRPTAARIGGARLEVVPGAPHGLFVTHLEEVNRLILDFIQA